MDDSQQLNAQDVRPAAGGGLGDLQLHRLDRSEDIDALKQWLGERRDFLAVDIETTGLNVGHDYIRLVQFGDSRHGWAIDYKDWRGVVKEVIEGYDRPMVAHNLLFDSRMLKQDGIDIPQRLAHDTMVMGHLLDPSARMDLKGLATMYVDRRAQIGQGLLRQTMQQHGWTWATVPTDVPAYWTYSALDTCLTSMLADKVFGTVHSSYREAYELEMAVIHCLREAEIAGLLIDETYRQQCIEKLEQDAAVLRAQIPAENPASDRQIIDMLHAQGAVWAVFTEKGNLSVDKDVLDMLAEHGYPVAGIVRRWRTARRLLDNYLYKLGPVNPYGFGEQAGRGAAVHGIIHASTRPVEARTGRMSVANPPLQQLPRGRVVRDAIIPHDDHCFVMADFSGMEMRALASLAREQRMLDVFNSGGDIHDATALALYGEGFTKPQRTVCKNAGFAKIYGAGLEKFAATAKITVEAAQQFLTSYDQLYPGVATFMQAVTQQVRDRAGDGKWGWIRLQDGRRLPVELQKAYVGVNYRIQGGCAVTMKKKMVQLCGELGEFFRLSVHDELIFEVPNEHAAAARDIVERIMPDRDDWPGVTLEIDSDIVSRWGEHYRDDYPAYIPTAPAPWLEKEAA